MLNVMDDCTGCGACMQICPKDAIHMEEDQEGFLHPVIDDELCIRCGLCEQSCHALNEAAKKLPQEVCVLQSKDEKLLEASSSGGAFSELARYILENNGCVYGAGWGEQFKVCHKRAENAAEMAEFRGSKYVQSDGEETFRQVKHDLASGKPVLYSGTPCQIAGLYRYLERTRTNTEELVTCDVICHGVCSPELWKGYIEYMGNVRGEEIETVELRNKKVGWSLPYMHIKYTGSDYYKSWDRDIFYRIFWSHNALREACYRCKYASVERISDITLADGLGFEYIKGWDTNKGISMVMINTQKGKQLFETIKDRVCIKEVKTDLANQPMLGEAAHRPEKRDEFWKLYQEQGFSGLAERYSKETILFRIKHLLVKPLLRVTGLYSVTNRIYIKIIKRK